MGSRRKTGGSGVAMRLAFLVAILVWRGGPAGATGTDPLIGPDGKIPLRILYTTGPKEERNEDFIAFLQRHFSTVATVDYKTFGAESAARFDVVVLDYGVKRPGAPVPPLDPGYSRATVTIGAAGSGVCNRLGLKPGYL